MVSKALCVLLAVLAVLLAVGLRTGPSAAAPDAPTAEMGGEIVISQFSGQELMPSIAYASKHNEYLVVWEAVTPAGYHGAYAQRVSGSGARVGSGFWVSSSPNQQMNPSVAYDPVNDRYLVVWAYDYHGDGSDWDIYGRLIPWSGPVAGSLDFGISGSTWQQRRPVVAYSRVQQEFLVTWTDAPAATATYISARRISAAGTFPAAEFVVSSGTDNRDYQDVAYNFSRNEYLVTFDLDSADTSLDIYGVRLSAVGEILTGGSAHALGDFLIAGWYAVEERPVAASCYQSDQYLVAWHSDQETGDVDYAIYARYINGDAVPGNIHLISDTGLPQMHVDLDCDTAGQKYLVAWQDQYVGGEFGIWARFAYPNEALGPEFEVMGPRYQADRAFPAVAGGRPTFLVAWNHELDDGYTLDIHGRLAGSFVYVPLAMRD